MQQPISKGIAQDYRDVLQTSDAPNMIDTEQAVVPVAVINSGVVRPTSRQSIFRYIINKAGSTSGQTQIVTPSFGQKVFFLGIACSINTGAQLSVFDNTTGTSTGADAATDVYYFQDAVGIATLTPPIIIPATLGIRFDWSVNVGGSLRANIYYMIERSDL